MKKVDIHALRPSVSVILGVYNEEKFIKQTVESILKQSFTNFEFIIIVNCSNDKTIDIIKTFNDKRIKIYKTNICQLAFNLNFGLYKSSGEYIVRIDADDIAKSDRIEKQLEVIKTLKCDVVGSNITYIDENNNVVGDKKYPQSDKEIRKNIYYKSIIAHPMYKKEVILSVGGYMNGKVSEDYDLWLRLMQNKKIKFYNIQEPLTMYRIHSNQTKGNKLAYAEIAGYFLRDALYLKSLKSFFGCVTYVGKMIFK